MSEKMTRIRLRGRKGRYGMLDWGERSFEQMFAAIRKKANDDLKVAQAILNADPDDFEVDVVRGPIVQKHVRKVERVK